MDGPVYIKFNLKFNAMSASRLYYLQPKSVEQKTVMEDGKPDLFSSLPSDLIRTIFSLLGLKNAVRTSILSNVWRSLWIPNHVNLDIDLDQITSHETTKEVLLLIGMFLRSCDGSRKLSLGLPNIGKRHSGTGTKDNYILLATKLVEEELHLNFSEEEKLTMEFNLILDMNCPNLDNHLAETTCFASLKTLHLRSVTHLAKNIVQALFSNCQLLENLKLVKCSGLQSLVIKAGCSFESFELVDCPEMVNINLATPNLKSFRYRGVLPCIQIRNASCLLDVMLDLRDGPGHNEFDCEELISLLEAIKDVEILTLSGWFLEWMCSAGVIFGKLEFQFNKLKELWWIGSSMDRIKRDSLACILNATPCLERIFIDIDRQLNSIPCPVFHHHWHEPHLWMDYATVKSNALPLEGLKIVVLEGFMHQEDELILIDLLLNKATTIESMCVKSRQNNSWQVAKIPNNDQLKQTLRKQWRKISISSIDNKYFYGEEDCSGLYPVHAQMC